MLYIVWFWYASPSGKFKHYFPEIKISFKTRELVHGFSGAFFVDLYIYLPSGDIQYLAL